MGRRCAWCATVLPAHGSAWSPGSEAICHSCYEELGAALTRSGLRVKQPSRADTIPPSEQPGPVLEGSSYSHDA